MSSPTGNIYEALVTLDAEFNVKPELCESYEVNNDGREYLYHLRTGIKFHNGEEMTADDVVASMNRWIEHYGNAQNTVGESRFEKVDDSTVKIVFDGPIAFFNELIATQSQGSVIMPKSVIENVDASTGEVQEYIGTGRTSLSNGNPAPTSSSRSSRTTVPMASRAKRAAGTAIRRRPRP